MVRRFVDNINNKSFIKNLLVFIGFVLVFIGILPLSAKAAGASFYVLPQIENYKIGQVFSVGVFVDTDSAYINAAQAKISFSPEILKVVNISKAHSIFSLWFQEPTFSNSKGEISFGGGLPNPGFKGNTGKVMTIFFQARGIGQTKLDFNDAKIIENGPRGTNLFSSSREGTYTIIEAKHLKAPVPKKAPLAPEVTSPTHPFQDKWYSDNSPEFHWEITPDITGVSFAFNQQPISEPGSVSQGVFSSKTFDNVADGIWYFHLKLKNGFGWGPSSHFKVQIDTQPPLPFEIVVDNEGDPTNPRPLLYFDTEDEVSGISHYEIKIGEGDVFKVFEAKNNPFRMPYQAPGTHLIIIKAVDKAQNFIEKRAEAKIESIAVPEVTACPAAFVSGAESMYIEGTATPNSQVLVFLRKDGKLVKKWNTISNKEGSWSLVERGLFKSGLYEITAITKDARGALSRENSLCFIRIILMGLAIGPWVIGYKTLSFIFLFIFILVLIGVFYLSRKTRATQRLIEKETEDLRQKFYKEYNELQASIERELVEVKKARRKRKISEAEKEREKELLESLADMKRVFEKEIKDIEGIK